MKNILLLVSLSLSLVYLGCKTEDTTNPPPSSPSDVDLIPGTSGNLVPLKDVDTSKVDLAKVLPCEITTRDSSTPEEWDQLSKEEKEEAEKAGCVKDNTFELDQACWVRYKLIQAFETSGCSINGLLDKSCHNRYNYKDCYKPKAPSPSSSSVVTCTRGNSDEELSFTFNTYNTSPGESLLCDVIDDKDNMLFFARNQAGSCRSEWSGYKAEQGYRCSDDPPEPEPVPEEVAPPPEEPVVEVDDTEYFTITNQGGGVIVTVILNDQQYVNLVEDDCVRLTAEDFEQISITTDANRDVCSVGNCGAADHYTVESRRGRFLWLSTVYRLILSSANPTCANTL